MSDLVNALPQHMTQDEVEFIYNVEVLGLPARKAASMANMSTSKILAPHIIQARESVKRELRGRLAITKEDVVHGYQDAIDQARVLGEPAVVIMGWEKIAKILGYDTPQKIDVHLTASVEVMAGQVKAMDDASLMKLLGADQIIDADFYDLGTDKSK